MSKTHLVIPDSHAHPDYHNKRYTWLGKLIVDIKPDVVIDIGDWWDMASLCSYDKGTKGFEGRRYKRDIEAGIEAQDRLKEPLRRAKRKLPRFVRTLGNHENRINRVVENDAVLEGTISLKDLQSKEYGWEEIPFLTPIEIDGIDYCHYFTSGVMGKPIGGIHGAHSLLTKRHKSSTMGHTHTFDHKVHSTGNHHIHGMVCGVYQDYYADYAGPANGMWRSQVVVKRGVENGNYDFETISLERIKREYS